MKINGFKGIPCDSIAPFQSKLKPFAEQTVYILDENGNY